jgi:hypothetical protein
LHKRRELASVADPRARVRARGCMCVCVCVCVCVSVQQIAAHIGGLMRCIRLRARSIALIPKSRRPLRPVLLSALRRDGGGRRRRDWTTRVQELTDESVDAPLRPRIIIPVRFEGSAGSRAFQLAAPIKAAINFVARPPVDDRPLLHGAD